jgi:uncharacterized protein YeaO (DUF488 family)
VTAGIGLRRAYDPPGEDDGWRVLVDRIWPRGMKRERLRLDGWEKDAAPSPGLRRWFGHDPAKWPEFRARYFAELDSRPEDLAELRARMRRGPLTLVYAARDREHNHAVALRDYLLDPDRDARRAEYASPPCFMHELDPAWAAPEPPPGKPRSRGTERK